MNKKLIAIFGLIIVLCVALVLPIGTAFADYEDIVLSEDAIVNFNQLITNGLAFSNTTTDTRTFFTPQLRFNNVMLYQNGIDENGTYYGYFTSSVGGTAMFRFYHSGSSTDITVYQNNSFTMVQDHIYYLRYYVASSNPSVVGGLKVNNLILIDLTLMFGSNDNVPTLEQCKELFVAEYYNYSSGYPLTFSTMTAYNNGINDGINATIKELASPTDFYNSIQNYYYVDTSSSTYYGGSVTKLSNGFVYISADAQNVDISQYNNTSSIAMLPLTQNIVNGATITISGRGYTDLGSGSQTNNYFSVYAFDNSGNFVKLADSPILSSNNPREFTFSFQNIVTANTIFIVPRLSSSYHFYFQTINVEQHVYDWQVLNDASYQEGYKEAETKYDKLYSPTGARYQAIYQLGYQAGHDAPTWSFKDLISASIDVPVQAFTSLFDFDILGVNMKTFYLSIFTLCVIFVILKLVL